MPVGEGSGAAAERAARSTVLRDLAAEGVSVWLDDAARDEFIDGSLRPWIGGGVATGLALSSAAMLGQLAGHHEHSYRNQISMLARWRAAPPDIVRSLHAHDARLACDLLAPVHAAARGLDGWVCLELDPRTAHDSASAMAEARALSLSVRRPNLLLKVPATPSGLEVVSECVSEGIGVNATLIHSPEQYAEVLEACWEGMERACRAGRAPVGGVCVASLEPASVEIEVDGRVGAADRLRGRVALALARRVYELHERSLDTDRWRALWEAGARPHRLVWAFSGTRRGGEEPGTGTTGHLSRRVRHVEEIVAWRTAHVLSREAVVEVARRARPCGDSLTGEAPAARGTLAALRGRGVRLESLAGELGAVQLERLVSDRDRLLGRVGVITSGPRGAREG